MMGSRLIYFSEVLAFFRKRLPSLLLVGVGAFALIFFGLLAFEKPKFLAEASFRQSSSTVEGEFSFQDILKSLHPDRKGASAQSVMKSKRLLEKVIEKTGLQMGRDGFSEVKYRGKEPLNVVLKPLDANTYKVVGGEEGKLGALFPYRGATWILSKMPEGEISLEISPMRDLLAKVGKRCTIKTSRHDPHLLLLSFRHRDRALAIGFVNALMEQYQEYLAKEHEEIALAQIQYLQKRREQLCNEFEGALDAHVAYLEKSGKMGGHMGLSQEVAWLNGPKEAYSAKSHQLDLELKKWKVPALEACDTPIWKEGQMLHEDLSLKRDLYEGEGALSDEFLGFDLKMAETLLDTYAAERETLSGSLEKIERVLDKIKDPQFDMGSLGQVLSDPTSQSILAKGAALGLQLADRANYTAKERKAIEETLKTQTLYLKAHLEKELETLRDHHELIEKKLVRLRGMALYLLEKEKASVEGKLGEISDQMQTLPAKWKEESLMKMQNELTMQIMEGISQLSESKVIHHHLFHVESGPLDPADAPFEPQSRYLLLLSSMGGILGSFAFGLILFIRAVQKGLPISRFYLLDHGYRLIEEPAVLEKLALYIGPTDVVALIGGSFAEKLRAVLKSKGYVARVEKMPQDTFSWQRPQGCTLLSCEEGLASAEAIRSIFLADRFVIQVKEERPEDLHPFPKEQTVIVSAPRKSPK